MLGILVRTRNDLFTETAFRHAQDILDAARDGGHIFIDVAAEMATKDNVMRILHGIGRPSDQSLKLVLFYCHGNSKSPIDQLGQDFITDETISRLAGWGVYCIGCDVGQTLGHRLLAAGAHFLIAFNSTVQWVVSHEKETFEGLNLGIIQMLREGIAPSAATDQMRQFFEKTVAQVMHGTGMHDFRRASSLIANARALAYYGPDVETPINRLAPGHRQAHGYPGSDISKDLNRIEPGHKQAREYQRIVSRILHEVFSPELDEPHEEVSNESGSSRYDIVFMNRAVHGFWHDIKVSRHNSVVIFDAKNKKELDPSDADQMLRYSSPWRGDVVFIVCRGQPSSAFSLRTAELLKEKGVCLIVLSETELHTMLSLKQQGNDPTIVVERLYRERIERS